LINVALPRVRDFRGVPPKGFDGRGNYALGLREQLIFPEIVYDKVERRAAWTSASSRRPAPTKTPRCSSRTWACRSGSRRIMAKTSLIMKSQRQPKFSTRAYSRCKLCGRPRGYLRKFEMCRLCFRELALKGEVPGIVKASW